MHSFPCYILGKSRRTVFTILALKCDATALVLPQWGKLISVGTFLIFMHIRFHKIYLNFTGKNIAARKYDVVGSRTSLDLFIAHKKDRKTMVAEFWFSN